MIESGYYPPGAEFDPDAPYNEPVIPEKNFEVTCCQTLSRTANVYTNNYIPGCCGCDYEDGETVAWHDKDDTSDTNWEEEYHDNDYHTPKQLIELFGQYLQEQLSKGIVFKSPKFTEHLIEECKGWEDDDTEYIQED